ncbi:MAG: molybdopterin-dependent oxidoreductase [bacterium]|nr:molybdopterin-dependent oxidoreductase [bacterium]
MERVVHRSCTLCEASCGISVHVDGDRISTIRGDAKDALSRGHICAKGWALKDLHEDPERLRQPIRRKDQRWERISWDEAFELASEGILAVRRKHGEDALAAYLGEPLVHNLGSILFSDEFIGALGTHKRFSANSLDQFPKQLACHWMYGSGLFIPVPDIDRTHHMLILGANPVVSNGSLMTAPGMRGRLQAIQKRGGRVVVIDPVRTETARLADEHHFIRPDTDPLLLAAMIHTIFAEDRLRMGRLGEFSEGLETLKRAVAGFAPRVVASRVCIPEDVIRSLALSFGDAESAVCYGRMGTSTVRFGTVTSWLVEVLNAITGNLDRSGGAMFPQPPVDVISLQPPTRRGRWHSRIRGTPEFMGELPSASLAEEISTPGDGQVRSLVTVAGNPVLSSPGGQRLDAALRELDFMVSIDFYLNETTRHAHLILPPVGPLERDHFEVAFSLFSVRNVPRWSPRVFDPPVGERSDGAILLELAQRLRRGRGGTSRVRALALSAALRLGADRAATILLDLALRTGPHGSGLLPWRSGLSLKSLRKAEHGIDLGPIEPALPGRLPGGRSSIDLAPKEIVQEVLQLVDWEPETNDGLLLIGRRESRSVNSWSHNLPSLVKGRMRCVLYIHPADAQERGIANGSDVSVSSRIGRIEVPAEITEAVMPGVVSLPHGYGHGREGTAMKIAADHPGASMNDLTDPERVDALSGNAVLSGIPVSVAPLARTGAE